MFHRTRVHKTVLSSRGGDTGSGGNRPIRSASAVVALGVAGLGLPVAFGAAALAARPLVAFAAAGALGALWIVWRGKGDATTVLTAYVLLLMFVPARLVVAMLGAAGTPAAIAGLVAAWLWGSGLLIRRTWTAPGTQPVRIALLLFGAAHMASFVAASLRPVDVLESVAADRGMVIVAAVLGIALFAADGLITRAQLDSLLRRLVLAGTGVAVIGILQFTAGLDLAASIKIPGLANNAGQTTFISDRSIFRRVAGTTEHAIEFSVVLAMILPLGIHYALEGTGRKDRRWWAAVAVMGVALPMSVSRTAVVGVAAVAMMLVPTWSRKRRRRAIIAAAAYVVSMRFLVPGLLGTIRAFFFSAGVDPSISARRGDYGYITNFISERPMFGRGFTTFVPTRYDFLDNQYLMSLVETGVVGLLSLIVLLVVSMSAARGARRRSDHAATRSLGQTLAASIAVGAVTCTTFDFLSFPTGRGLLFLLIGCVGALWRLEARPRLAGAVVPVTPTRTVGAA